MSSPPVHPPDLHSPSRPAPRVVRVAGEIDLDTAGRFRRDVDAVPDLAPGLVIDLREVTFMSCAGLPVLLAAQQRFGARLQLLGPCPPVSRLLTHCELDAELVLVAVPEAGGTAAPVDEWVGSRAS